ncbi:MAG: outer membrane lipoprotein carrier protein LolA [Flavobacteriales bacterium]|nr:outer membrane lipoprotein carrier protein LolA [Flavobacteriales bacterium]
MKLAINILIAFLFLGTAYGQEDAKAKKILDDLSSKTKAYKSMAVTFSIVITNAEDGSKITQKGKAYLKGDKYKIELEEQDIYCDGETVTTHLKLDKECYTSDVDEAEEDGSVTPSNMLTIWEEGYKYEYKRETTFKDIPVHQIHLYPKDPKDSKFHTIILKIDKAKNELLSVYIKGKDGNNMRYILKNLEENVEIPESKFVFDRSKHPEVECYEE